jgi:hypothetical protein
MKSAILIVTLLVGCGSILPPMNNPDYAAARFNAAISGLTNGHELVCSTMEGFFWVKHGGEVEITDTYAIVVDIHGHRHIILRAIAVPNCSVVKE